MQLYIKAKSKKEVNERLKKGERIGAVEYGFMNTSYHTLQDVDHATVKIFEKMVGGSPYAKAYGTWDKAKNKLS